MSVRYGLGMWTQYLPYILAAVSALCQVSVAGYAIYCRRKWFRFERAFQLMTAGPRADAKTIAMPMVQAPRTRTR